MRCLCIITLLPIALVFVQCDDVGIFILYSSFHHNAVTPSAGAELEDGCLPKQPPSSGSSATEPGGVWSTTVRAALDRPAEGY